MVGDWLQWYALFIFLVFINALVGSVVAGKQKYTIVLGFMLLLGPLFLRIWEIF